MMGEVVLAGPCKAPIVLDIQGILLANTDPSAYSNVMWILIEHVDGIKILGGGTINGQGKEMWQYAGEGNSGTRLPVVSVLFFTCSTH